MQFSKSLARMHGKRLIHSYHLEQAIPTEEIRYSSGDRQNLNPTLCLRSQVFQPTWGNTELLAGKIAMFLKTLSAMADPTPIGAHLFPFYCLRTLFCHVFSEFVNSNIFYLLYACCSVRFKDEPKYF